MRRRSGFGWLELAIGIILIALGILVFLKPDLALTGMVFAYGIAAVVMGIADIVLFIEFQRYTGFGPILALVSGVLSVMSGLMLVVYPGTGALVLTVLFPGPPAAPSGRGTSGGRQRSGVSHGHGGPGAISVGGLFAGGAGGGLAGTDPSGGGARLSTSRCGLLRLPRTAGPWNVLPAASGPSGGWASGGGLTATEQTGGYKIGLVLFRYSWYDSRN